MSSYPVRARRRWWVRHLEPRNMRHHWSLHHPKCVPVQYARAKDVTAVWTGAFLSLLLCSCVCVCVCTHRISIVRIGPWPTSPRAPGKGKKRSVKPACSTLDWREVEAHMLTPGMPGPMVLCGGLIPPPKFWKDGIVTRHRLGTHVWEPIVSCKGKSKILAAKFWMGEPPTLWMPWSKCLFKTRFQMCNVFVYLSFLWAQATKSGVRSQPRQEVSESSMKISIPYFWHCTVNLLFRVWLFLRLILRCNLYVLKLELELTPKIPFSTIMLTAANEFRLESETCTSNSGIFFFLV